MTDNISSCADAVQSIAGGVAKVCADEMHKHGPDPRAPAIIAAALCMFVNNADEILPGLKKTLIGLLK